MFCFEKTITIKGEFIVITLLASTGIVVQPVSTAKENSMKKIGTRVLALFLLTSATSRADGPKIVIATGGIGGVYYY
jgi:hypothetical protein